MILRFFPSTHEGQLSEHNDGATCVISTHDRHVGSALDVNVHFREYAFEDTDSLILASQTFEIIRFIID